MHVHFLPRPARTAAPVTAHATAGDRGSPSPPPRRAAGDRGVPFSRRGLLSSGAALAAGGPMLILPKKAYGSEELATSLNSRLSQFTLPNGMHFNVLERHGAPVCSVHTLANVGAFDESNGQTGIAHLLEHMAFKGTQRLGTTDYEKEAPILEAQDVAFYASLEERAAGNIAEAKALEAEIAALQLRADAMQSPNALGSLLEREGAVGLNASTSQDNTQYYCSLPVNKLELWFAIEADRFRYPVFRELYAEKKVVLEERVQRVDNSPFGGFMERFLNRSLGNNYSRPTIGYAEDIQRIGRGELTAFFDANYGPDNLTVSIVGDVSPDQVYTLAQKYFGSWSPQTVVPGAPSDALVATRTEVSYENYGTALFPQMGATRSVNAVPWAAEEVVGVRVNSQLSSQTKHEGQFSEASRAGPLAIMGHYRPSVSGLDDAALDVLSDAMAGSRTAIMDLELTEGTTPEALSVSFVPGFPGEKHPNLVLLYGQPAPGKSIDGLLTSMRKIEERVASDGFSDSLVARISRQNQVSLLKSLRSNSSMASLLSYFTTVYGSSDALLTELASIEAMTPERVRTIAERLFDADNGIVARAPKI